MLLYNDLCFIFPKPISLALMLLSCFTGLSYSDAQKATVDNLSRENDGRLWLITYRNKTEVKSTVLLLDIAIKYSINMLNKENKPDDYCR